jgi:hypothetical protein
MAKKLGADKVDAKRVAHVGAVRAFRYSNAVTGRFLAKSEDIAEFEAATKAYLKKHAKSKEQALKALQAMGMVTATGRPTKHYR